MSDTNAIVQDEVTGLFGFRLEMGRGHDGIRMQVRRTGFARRACGCPGLAFTDLTARDFTSPVASP